MRKLPSRPIETVEGDVGPAVVEMGGVASPAGSWTMAVAAAAGASASSQSADSNWQSWVLHQATLGNRPLC